MSVSYCSHGTIVSPQVSAVIGRGTARYYYLAYVIIYRLCLARIVLYSAVKQIDLGVNIASYPDKDDKRNLPS